MYLYFKKKLKVTCGYSALKFHIILCTFTDRRFLGLEPEIEQKVEIWNLIDIMVRQIYKLLSNHHLNQFIFNTFVYFKDQQNSSLKKDKNKILNQDFCSG
jgi:hypothetical protein